MEDLLYSRVLFYLAHERLHVSVQLVFFQRLRVAAFTAGLWIEDLQLFEGQKICYLLVDVQFRAHFDGKLREGNQPIFPFSKILRCNPQILFR